MVAGKKVDGPAATAIFNNPCGMVPYKNAVGVIQFLYVADTGNHCIRKIDMANRMVSTLSGSGTAAYTDATTGAASAFNAPRKLTISADGSVLYVCDTGNNCIRTVNTATGATFTIAGNQAAPITLAMATAPTSYSFDASFNGNGTAARFSTMLAGIALYGTKLFVIDTMSNCIRMVSTVAPYTVTTYAGRATNAGWVGVTPGITIDGVGANASLCFYSSNWINIYPDLCVDSAGTLYFCDYATGYSSVRMITTDRMVTTYYGINNASPPPIVATTVGIQMYREHPRGTLYRAIGVSIDSANNLYVMHTHNHITKITPARFGLPIAASSGDPTTFTTTVYRGAPGTNGFIDGDVCTTARFNTIMAICPDVNGDLYIADSLNHRIRKLGLEVAPTIETTSVPFVGATSATLAWKWGTNPDTVVITTSTTPGSTAYSSPSPFYSGGRYNTVPINAASPLELHDLALPLLLVHILVIYLAH
jgi:hypothetical protein